MKLFKRIPYVSLLVGPWAAYALGALLNVVVVALNHGQMPVAAPPGITIPPGDWVHVIQTSASHLKLFADWIYWGDGYYSIGDMFILGSQATYVPALAAWIALVIRDAQPREVERPRFVTPLRHPR